MVAMRTRGNTAPRGPDRRSAGGTFRLRERFVTVDHRTVRVVEAGRLGPPLLLFHGAGGWAETWGGLLPALARSGYHAYACDLPGFGESARHPSVRYFDPGRSFYVRWTRRLMDLLELKRATLVGHSLGGTVAMLTAADEPSRALSLALLAPGGFGDAVGLRLRLLGSPLVERLAPYVPRAVLRDYLRSCVYDPESIPEWLLEGAFRYARAGAGAEFARVVSQGLSLLNGSNDSRARWMERLARIRCPTLVLWGREDRTLPASHAREAASALPGATVQLIDRAGHLLPLEKPRLVRRALLAFLRASHSTAGHARPAAALPRPPVQEGRDPGTDFAMQPSP